MAQKLFELIITLRKKCLQTEEAIRSELKLTPGEFNGLLSIESGEKVPGLVFSHRLGLSASRGSRVLNRMLDNGYITLSTVPDDRRSAEASLTHKGTRMRQSILELMEACEKKIVSQLSGKETELVMRTLQRLVEVM